ncbi:uncharacterized protein MEPE_02380 [Melanopsichium pennsylvanicum]|uniref:Uncharacterized protein n=2 Tax=Melanopsichium pennsylvanicum TaxID=63383 RepID=A0AAJ4XKA5_9BASI|nr:putative protein [Melanopsichium pennsylvanicum 4]SNX83673.1 uncharacterized protein MEPE_02380 [Melanopsichium pennsylvanicum]
MQSSASRAAGGSSSPRRQDPIATRKIVYTQLQTSEHPPSSSRIVIAEGSEFILEPVPSRASPSTSGFSSLARHVSAPDPSTSSSSHPIPDPHSRSVSSSNTPPRTRPADRPYRPPPSSSARFYERQQQLWMLQQPNSIPSSSLAHVSTILKLSQVATHRSASVTGLRNVVQPTPSPRSYASNSELLPPSSSRSQCDSYAFAQSRSRATSVSFLASPEPLHAGRARSGSDASSFTRSRISNGYQSLADDDSVDQDSYQSFSAMSFRLSDKELQANAAIASAAPVHCQAASLISGKVPKTLLGAETKQRNPSDSSLGESGDADWDAELGISEDDHAEPLRLPLLNEGEQVSQSYPKLLSDKEAANPNVTSSRLVVTAAAAPAQADSHLQSLHTADLKGIRVTSSVRENWDDDFLFQNEMESTPQSCRDAESRASIRAKTSASGATTRLLHQQDEEDDGDDVENWDDAFSWNADPRLTPSASTTSSLQKSGRWSHDESHDGIQSSSQRLPPDVRPHLNFGSPRYASTSKKRHSDASAASDATDFSARLAAQSDIDSVRPKLSQDSDDFSTRSKQRSPHGVANDGRRGKNSIGAGSDASGDDTETETPSEEPAPATKSRTTRRSLGAALGFDSSSKSVFVNNSAASTQSPSQPLSKQKDHTDSAGAKSHSRSQSKSKLGALQRLSFSRSRTSVANVCSSSVNETTEEGDTLRIYSDHVSRSQASLLSQLSSSSNRSNRGASPTSLEKSYAALRNTSFRRLLGRGDKSTAYLANGVEAAVISPSSLPRRGSELAQPLDAMISPSRHRPSTRASDCSMSPPTSRSSVRRSSEATPTRSRESGGLCHESPSQVPWNVPGSPTKVHASLKSPGQCFDTVGVGDLDTQRQSVGRSFSKDISSYTSGLGFTPTAGFRRECSSSNTLRANLTYGAENASTPSRSRRNESGSAAIARSAQAPRRESQARFLSEGASVDGATAPYPYLGEKMLRGSEDRGSASRSVCASTTHSHTSAESLYGYRMRKQISVSSGPDAHDSETSYGTSVSSSPGLSYVSSSGWLSHGKRGATPSMDTRDTAWTASVDLSGRNEPSSEQNEHSSRVGSVTGSPLCLDRTFEGAPVVFLPSIRKQSAPDNSFSKSRYASLAREDTHITDAPWTPCGEVASHPHRLSPVKKMTSTADPSVPILTAASAPSLQKPATRRNSLSDLKIPSRISKAQTGIRNNISLVRDFAKGIEELKLLKASYMYHQTRAPLSSADAQASVQNWLECADVLIGLGQGRSEADSAARVDTVSHTPLSARVDSRRATLSDVSRECPPRSPSDGIGSRQSSVSGARSTSGTSQATTSTTDGVRSVDAQREIDILSAILGSARVTTSTRADRGSHGRFQSETYTRDEMPQRDAERSAKPSNTPPHGASVALSNLTTPDRDSFDDGRFAKPIRTKRSSERPFNTAPVNVGLNEPTEVVSLNGVDVGDANRSAKRRLRSASRAGLQGLRELLKVFKGAVADEIQAPSKNSFETDAAKDDTKDEMRYSLDRGPTTPPTSKQKRRSLNLKRRSFLRSKTSLESMQVKPSDLISAQETTPPMPTLSDSNRSAYSTGKFERKMQGPSQSKSSLDITWEDGSRDAKKQPGTHAKAGRRISLQSALSGKRRSVDLAHTSVQSTKQLHTTDSRSANLDLRRPSLAVRPQSNLITTPDPRRASTSVDSVHHQSRPQEPLRSQSSVEEVANKLQPPMVQKLALRPEAMPGLLVYVQATKQHLQLAIDELGSPIST